MQQTEAEKGQLRLAETVRDACAQVALEAYESASVSGLCHEGAWECAIGAIHALDVEDIVRAYKVR